MTPGVRRFPFSELAYDPGRLTHLWRWDQNIASLAQLPGFVIDR
jgi:hypothetical protein